MTSFDRRDFLGLIAAAGMAPLPPAQLDRRRTDEPTATVLAPDGRALTAGLVGCGGRGCGAAVNFLAAGPHLRVTALADVFPDRLSQARTLLEERAGQEIPASRCFAGFDAYEKVIEAGVDIVLLATPPHFRPAQFAAAVAAGKHTFLEKPLAVDGPGVRDVLRTGKQAEAKGLSGTQLRRQRSRIELRRRVLGGEIGDIVAMRAFRNQGALWHREREPQWSDMESMIRDWVNWTWLSGDHIVEQHIHHLDAILWVIGKPPARATGMGARMRRPTGDQYDFFSVDYAFDPDVHLHSTIRQISGCDNVRDESVVGTKGVANLSGSIADLSGREVWRFEGPEVDPLIQEHADLVAAIRSGTPINTTEPTAISTLVAIMGRDSAYTGRTITWAEAQQSAVRLGPTTYAMGAVTLPSSAPVPGSD
jgi:myo-inositol 2-dehydrogenase / D-chiro-inositol 1-dehydrogenase